MATRTATTRRLLAALALTAPVIMSGCASAGPSVVTPAPSPSAEALPSEPAPTTLAPLPLARNGSDLSSCRSGRCQVIISGPTTLTVGGITLTASVSAGGVTVNASDANDNHAQVATSPGGANTLGLSGQTITVRVLGVQGDRAVLDLS